jgi:pimeloyl-ACP methyl ester carboxylesterase
MASIMVGDMRMYYVEAGHPDGSPLVLLHGFNGSGAAWAPQLDALGAHYRLILPDLRGHGRSDNPAGIVAMNHRQFARDIAGFCAALGIQRAAFCGESTGSMLQLSLALFAPDLVAACVLAAATYYFPDTARAMFRQLTPDTLPEQFRTRFQSIHVALGPDHWRMVVEANHNLHSHVHAEDFPEQDELPRITAPVLIVHGDRDPALPLDIPTSLYTMLPNAELCLLPNTGHNPPAEHPAWFNAIALDFLTRRYATTAAEQ